MLSPRARILAACAAPVVALFAVAASAPLPYSVAYPGPTADVLGSDAGRPVITVSGVKTRTTSGRLRATTITATGPDATVRLNTVLSAWFDGDRAVMPRDSVYPVGDTSREIERHNLQEMAQSQDDATSAALRYLRLSPKDVHVRLRLADVGGPSAGLLFALGIVDKIAGDGRGGDLTGGRTIAGTGTVTARGEVGEVGGVSLKTQAARRDGATVFLVPKGECADAKDDLPKGLRLVPVSTLSGAVDALRALGSGGRVPHC
ncbi:S16 family serine protease [Streptomyces sp. B1866]|uniref:S16 family serine protease n=1 Tax=Streptomyces sp. B1866 TaxID=3075431 RepID=UPI00288ECC23|nr:S16 family serine protease [Streptomyces sp. B1866]MDT3396907.1 S16 family serine protease [Streptomyces sp. B1866]